MGAISEGPPGHSVTIGERIRAKAAAPSTANGFVVGFTERGPSNRAVLIESLAQYVEEFGARVTYGALYDALDVAFREGLSSCYVGRIVGPAPVLATAPLPAASGNSMRVDAASAGVWGNDLDVIADATGATFTLRVDYLGQTQAQSPAHAHATEAIAWAAAAAPEWITLTDLGGGDPVDGTASPAGGTDDHAAATDASRQNALALFERELGPGQVAAPGFTTAQAYDDLLDHAAANNRRAVLDAPNSGTIGTLTAASLALRGRPDHSERFGGMFWPWATCPGLSPGTIRTVPYSGVQLGLIAKAEAETLNPNKAAAGKRGRAAYATGLSQAPVDATVRRTLNDSGINLARLIRGVVTTYGNRTLTNPLSDGDWKSLSASRLVMAVAADCDEVLEDFDFEQIDGHRFVFHELEGRLSGQALMPWYIADALYGPTPSDAFSINTGPDVNTPATISAEEIHASVGIRVSPTGEFLNVEVVKVPVTEEV